MHDLTPSKQTIVIQLLQDDEKSPFPLQEILFHRILMAAFVYGSPSPPDAKQYQFVAFVVPPPRIVAPPHNVRLLAENAQRLTVLGQYFDPEPENNIVTFNVNDRTFDTLTGKVVKVDTLSDEWE